MLPGAQGLCGSVRLSECMASERSSFQQQAGHAPHPTARSWQHGHPPVVPDARNAVDRWHRERKRQATYRVLFGRPLLAATEALGAAAVASCAWIAEMWTTSPAPTTAKASDSVAPQLAQHEAKRRSEDSAVYDTSQKRLRVSRGDRECPVSARVGDRDLFQVKSERKERSLVDRILFDECCCFGECELPAAPAAVGAPVQPPFCVQDLKFEDHLSAPDGDSSNARAVATSSLGSSQHLGAWTTTTARTSVCSRAQESTTGGAVIGKSEMSVSLIDDPFEIPAVDLELLKCVDELASEESSLDSTFLDDLLGSTAT